MKTEQILRAGAAQLKAAGVASAAYDARLLLQELFGISHAALLSGRARALTAAEQALYARALARRARHEPVHRILGRRAFYGREFALSDETLEPRPDTEALVELALPYIRAAAEQKARGADRDVTLLDMGTGSGIIALTLLAEVPRLCAAGADISAQALQTAQKNARALGLGARFSIWQGDWFQALSGKRGAAFDFIVSNPPYIARAEIETLAAEVRLYDPRRALDGGADGLDFYRALACQARPFLKPCGKIAVEIGYGQEEAVIGLFAQAGFGLLAAQRDLSGVKRALLFA